VTESGLDGSGAGVDVAVVGAGVIGCAVSWALTKAGRRVLLIDRADPGTAGASFGNVGHIATEQLQPLPSPPLLFNFWRQLVGFGGVLDIPLRRVVTMSPWMMRFALAAFRLEANTRHLAPLVSNAADVLESQLLEVGRGDLIRRNGHYALWLGPHATARAAAERARALSIGVPTADAPIELLRAAAAIAEAPEASSVPRSAAPTAHARETGANTFAVGTPAAGAMSTGGAAAHDAGTPTARGEPGDVGTAAARAVVGAGGASPGGQMWAAGVWYPASAHVLDPAQVARAFATASAQAGGSIVRAEVRHVRPRGDGVEILTDKGTFTPRTTIICAGAWSPPLLAPFGINAPIEAERGYHIELPNHAPLIDAPILYADHSVVVTPMASRLRASTFLEFAGLGAPPDPDKPRRLRAKVRQMGYDCAPEGPSWMGPRPTLPDYLPGIGRAPGPHELYYAVGHQHLGLTLSAVTADLIAALVMGRAPRFDVTAFDLGRFGSP
jgi:glycine/D-amino acid oxidase-like deaminating enzyme